MVFLDRCPVDQAKLDELAESSRPRVPDHSSPAMQIMDMMSKLAKKLPEKVTGSAKTDLATAKAPDFLQLVATSTSKQLARMRMRWSWGKLFKFAVGLSCAIATVATVGAAGLICIGIVLAANIATDAITGDLSKGGVGKCLFNAACSTVDIFAPGIGSLINIGETVAETTYTEYDRQRAGLFKEECRMTREYLADIKCPEYSIRVTPEAPVSCGDSLLGTFMVRNYRIDTSWTVGNEEFHSMTKYPFSYLYQAFGKFSELGGACATMWSEFPGRYTWVSAHLILVPLSFSLTPWIYPCSLPCSRGLSQ